MVRWNVVVLVIVVVVVVVVVVLPRWRSRVRLIILESSDDGGLQILDSALQSIDLLLKRFELLALMRNGSPELLDHLVAVFVRGAQGPDVANDVAHVSGYGLNLTRGCGFGHFIQKGSNQLNDAVSHEMNHAEELR